MKQDTAIETKKPETFVDDPMGCVFNNRSQLFNKFVKQCRCLLKTWDPLSLPTVIASGFNLNSWTLSTGILPTVQYQGLLQGF